MNVNQEKNSNQIKPSLSFSQRSRIMTILGLFSGTPELNVIDEMTSYQAWKFINYFYKNVSRLDSSSIFTWRMTINKVLNKHGLNAVMQLLNLPIGEVIKNAE